MNFQDWIDLFQEQHWYAEWFLEFSMREAKDLEKNWFGVEDWLYSTYYTDFISSSFVYSGEQKWEDIEKEWYELYTEYEG